MDMKLIGDECSLLLGDCLEGDWYLGEFELVFVGEYDWF